MLVRTTTNVEHGADSTSPFSMVETVGKALLVNRGISAD